MLTANINTLNSKTNKCPACRSHIAAQEGRVELKYGAPVYSFLEDRSPLIAKMPTALPGIRRS
jgi:hypothetical protein